MKFEGFVGGNYKDNDNLFLAGQDCINLYPQIQDVQDKERIILTRTPGTVEFAALDIVSGPIRGQYTTTQDRMFVVKFNKLVEVFRSGNAVVRGSINTNYGKVNMADNGEASTGAGNQLMLVDGDFGYIYNLANNTLQIITSPNFPRASNVIYQDTYFIVNEVGTNQVHISESFDGLTWSGFQGGAEGSPDIINNIINTSRNIWVFGTKSLEVWQDVGTAGFPYQRIDQTYQDIGLVAVESLASINNNIFFFGANNKGYGRIYSTDGIVGVVPISDHLIESEIQSYSNPSDAIGMCYQQDGHTFYVLNFQSANKTWVYETTTKMWHQRRSGLTGRWQYNYASFIWNKVLVSNSSDGKLYDLSSDYLQENGSFILRQRTSPHVFDNEDNNWMFYDNFELEAKVGVGLGGLGLSNPIVLPEIIVQPQSVQGSPSTTVSIYVIATGDAVLTYQWYKDGQIVNNNERIAGATNNILYINNYNSNDVGFYYCIVTNMGGSASSQEAILSITTGIAPNFVIQPESSSPVEGATVHLSALAAGDEPITYQWYFNGNPIEGATSTTYTINPMTEADYGDYYVIATNDFGSAQSNTATLSVPPSLWSRSFSYTQDGGEDFLLTAAETDASPFYPYVNKRMLLTGAVAIQFDYNVEMNGGSDGWNLKRGVAVTDYSDFKKDKSFNQVTNYVFGGWQTGEFGWTYFVYGGDWAVQQAYSANGIWGNPLHGTTTLTISALKMNGKRDVNVNVIGYDSDNNILFSENIDITDFITGSDILLMTAGAADTNRNDGSFSGSFTYL